MIMKKKRCNEPETEKDLLCRDYWPQELTLLYDSFNTMAARIRQSHEQLEEKVNQRTQELYAANQELAAKNREMVAVNAALQEEILERRWVENELERVRSVLEYSVDERTSELYDTNQRLQQELNERKRTEQELDESRERYAAAFRFSADVIMLANATDMRCLEVSDAFYEKFGYQPDEVIGQTSAETGFWPWPRQRAEYLAQLMLRQSVRSVEAHWRTKSGEMRIGVISGDVLSIGGQRCVLFTWHDVTDHKKAEEALRRINEDLEEKVELRTGELTAMNQELLATNQELNDLYRKLQETQDSLVRSEKMAALARLVTGMAHEINTPVGICVTLSSHLEDRTRDMEKIIGEGSLRRKDLEEWVDECRESAHMLLLNADRAAKLVANFKQVSDQTGESRRSFNVRAYADEVLLLLHSRLKRFNHVVSVRGGENLRMDGYPGALAQILTNLLLNSLIHAYDEGESGRIDIELDSIADCLALTYHDDGKGMDSETKGKIFDPFFTTRRNQGQTGLGLCIVYNLVTQLYGGTIECISSPGAGTTFAIKLPLQVHRGEEAASRE